MWNKNTEEMPVNRWITLKGRKESTGEGPERISPWQLASLNDDPEPQHEHAHKVISQRQSCHE